MVGRIAAKSLAAGILLLALPAGAEEAPRDEPAAVAQFLVCDGKLAAACEAFRRGELEAAVRPFREAAEAGDAAARNNLGVLLETGLGVARSKPEALRWYRMAAEQGLPMAQYNLAVLLATDHVLGTHPEPGRRRADFIEAYAWLLVAAEGGLEMAERTRQDLVVRMTPEEVGEARAQAARRIAESQP